jgi:tetratricopeptide (TPR) repeat protein
LLKAFRVIRAIRRVAKHLHPQKTLDETYFQCLLLYNLAVLKYSREVALVQDGGDTKEHDHQLQVARLCFIAAAAQGRWLENPPRPFPRLRGILEQLREGLIGRLAGFARPVLYLFIVLFLVTLLGLAYIWYQAGLQERRARAEHLNDQETIYLQQGKLEVATDHFRQAIQADPEYPTAYHNLGMAYFIQDDPKRAKEQFQTAITLEPAYASPHYALGRVYDDLGQTEEALRELRQAVELDPGMSEAYSELGYMLNQQERYDEAVNILYKGLEQGREPNPPFLLKNLGQAYLGLEDPAQAVHFLEIAAARLRPGDALYIETHRLLAQAYEANGAIDQAVQEWQGPLRDESDAPEQIRRLRQRLVKGLGIRDWASMIVFFQ